MQIAGYVNIYGKDGNIVSLSSLYSTQKDAERNSVKKDFYLDYMGTYRLDKCEEVVS